MSIRISQLYFEFKHVPITLTDKDTIEFRDPPNFTIDELEAILAEAKAFREYRKSREPLDDKYKLWIQHMEKCSKPLIYTKEMLIDSLHKDNDIKEVIQVNEGDGKPQALIEVPAFETNGFSHHRCNTSQYWITTDGRIKIDPPAPYDVFIYTTVDEIKRLRAMDDKELMAFMKEYSIQTYPNKRYALRAFLRDIADDVFPPVESTAVTINHDLGKVPKMIMAWPVTSEEHALEPTVTPEPADERDDTPESNIEYHVDISTISPTPAVTEYPLPKVTPTPKPEDPYVVKTRMSKKTAALWEKFAKPPSEITKDDNAGAYLS